MYCTKCNKHLGDCECPDIQERLAAIGNSRHVAVKWCRTCDKYYAKCECVAPDFYVRLGGQEMPR